MKISIYNIIKKMILPLLIGFTVTFLLFRNEFSSNPFENFIWTPRMIYGLLMAILFVIGRDFGLAWRFHTIATPDLSWKKAIKTDLICAFTSAITPSAMGGSAFAIFYLNKEGVNLGKATTMTLTTLFLDELFFVIFCPIILWLTPLSELFGNDANNSFLMGVKVVFWFVYAGIVVWTVILFLGIIVNPGLVVKCINRLFSLKFLSRWKKGAMDMGLNMIETSAALRKVSFKWWLNVFGATVLSWFSRYLIVNALFWGFVPNSSPLIIFSRQFVVWVLLMISPTPGGSGISEWIFTKYYGDLIGSSSLILIIALTWRIITYYIYLIIGSLILPSYFRKK